MAVAAAPGKARTLSIDIGGTGLKAAVLDAKGEMVSERLRAPTTYPLPPEALLEALVRLASSLPPYTRISAGFPGMVRAGRILTAPHFSMRAGPGSRVVPELRAAWSGFDLAAALQERLGKPARVVNDADLQGMAVIDGKGLELVVTLGTGVGTGLFLDGRLCPHLEIAQHPLRKGGTYNDRIGDAARQTIGNARWNRRVQRALETLDVLLMYDRLHVGGGNSRHITFDLGPRGQVVDNAAGVLGGIRLWERGRL